MKALALRTRFRHAERDGDACLLVYDSAALPPSTISADVRDILIHRPNTPWIYVLCPFMPSGEAWPLLFDSLAPERAGCLISLVTLWKVEGAGGDWEVEHVDKDGTRRSLENELVHGWLFDLFDSRGGLVRAPAGVHFTKLSGQHTDRFLRTSNVLLTSAAVGVIAFFSLALVGDARIRRVYVDTAPLISVAFAMTRVARAFGMSLGEPEVESFSSYGGLGNLPPVGASDLFLLSASTSGSLATALRDRGATERMIITLFLLGPSPREASMGQIVCNLTLTPDRLFGYERVVNASAAQCGLCKRNYLQAPLEGDQFMLHKRDAVRLRVSRLSQPGSARETMSSLAKRRLWAVDRFATSYKTNVRFDLAASLQPGAPLLEPTVRLLRRFTPAPLDVIVLIGIDTTLFQSVAITAGLQMTAATIYAHGDLSQMPARAGGRVLVMVGVLDDHAQLRGVNAQMRIKAPHGDVTYLSALTIVDSGQTLHELSMFLSYGERGLDTFTFRSAQTLMLPNPDGGASAWSQEIELLQRMRAELEGALAPRLERRLAELSEGISTDSLFIAGKDQPLSISADFVYLDTNGDISTISQADIFVVVANLLATARCDNVGLTTPPGKLPGGVVKSQSVYGQVLVNLATLCPRNLRDYNDAVLRAAMLRAAHVQELNYAVDAACSAEVLPVFEAELESWTAGHGNASPEILMALATGRLQLYRPHLERLVSLARRSIPEDWAQQLLEQVVATAKADIG